jgi:hypothetical protein
LDRWEIAYRKENFYRGIRVLLELQRDGSSSFVALTGCKLRRFGLLLPASVGIIGTQRFSGGQQMQGTQLKYAIKFVADMDKAVKFYRDVLGLKVKFESPGWSEFVTGETTLALHPASDKN